MTERTYKKDLDILHGWWRDQLGDVHIEQLQPLFALVEQMVQHHGVFLRDLEHRLLLWEGRSAAPDTHRIGDIMLKNMCMLPVSVFGASMLRYREVHQFHYASLSHSRLPMRRSTRSTSRTTTTSSIGCTRCTCKTPTSGAPTRSSSCKSAATFRCSGSC